MLCVIYRIQLLNTIKRKWRNTLMEVFIRQCCASHIKFHQSHISALIKFHSKQFRVLKLPTVPWLIIHPAFTLSREGVREFITRQADASLSTMVHKRTGRTSREKLTNARVVSVWRSIAMETFRSRVLGSCPRRGTFSWRSTLAC